LIGKTSTPLSLILKERKEKKKPSLAYKRLKKNKLFINCGTYSKTHILWVWGLGGGGDGVYFHHIPKVFPVCSQCVP
jgi:hypothetical protein